MGGINHQPCRNSPAYLIHSTRMSRFFSRARSFFEQANEALEDVLLSEIEGVNPPGTIRKTLLFLDSCKEELLNMRISIADLVAEMRRAGYTDLPTFRTTDLVALGHVFSQVGIVAQADWDSIVEQMREGSFYQVLEGYGASVSELIDQSEQLATEIGALEDAAKARRLSLVLENNEDGNIKATFAQIYHSWNDLTGKFLASSMLTTELWYRHNRTGSILEHCQSDVAAA
ncbi:MAG: hypothetical protein ACYC75_01315 [Minisyncoccota bacterium]